MGDKVKEGAPYEIRLAHPVPVIWVYLTGWSNGDGPANFRDDVYGMDTVGDAVADVLNAPQTVSSTRRPTPAAVSASRAAPAQAAPVAPPLPVFEQPLPAPGQ